MTPKELKAKAQRLLNKWTQKGCSVMIRDDERGWNARGVLDSVQVFRVAPVYDEDDNLERVRYLVGMFFPYFWAEGFKGARLYSIEELIEEDRQLVLKSDIEGRDYLLGNLADGREERDRDNWIEYLEASEGRELRELALDQFRQNNKERIAKWQ